MLWTASVLQPLQTMCPTKVVEFLDTNVTIVVVVVFENENPSQMMVA